MTQWAAYPQARQTKQFFPELRSAVSKEVIKMTRREIGRFVRLVSGHNIFNYHMSLKSEEHEQRCRFCGHIRETFFHFITECPRFLSLRADIFLNYGGPNLIGEDWRAEDILTFSKENRIDYAYRYQPGGDVDDDDGYDGE